MTAHGPNALILRVAGGSATVQRKGGPKIEVELSMPMGGAGAIFQVKQGELRRFYSTDLRSLIDAAVRDFEANLPEPRT